MMTNEEVVVELHELALDYARFAIDNQQCDQAEPVIAIALSPDTEGGAIPIAMTPVGALQQSSAGKDMVAKLLMMVWNNHKALASLYVSEAWCLTDDKQDGKIQDAIRDYEEGKIGSLENAPGRIESLMITITTRDGKQRLFAHKIITGEGGKRSVSNELIGALGDHSGAELGGRFGHLGPVPDVKHQH